MRIVWTVMTEPAPRCSKNAFSLRRQGGENSMIEKKKD